MPVPRKWEESPLSTSIKTNALWLIKLRWVAVAGQFFTIAGVRYVLGIELSLLPLLVVVGVAAVTNLLLMAWYRLRPEDLVENGPAEAAPRHTGRMLLAGVMLLDLLLLTALLYFSGGPYNPFSVFYFVNLSLAALIVPGRWAWLLTATAIACYAALFFHHVPLRELGPVSPVADGAEKTPFLSVRDKGLLVAFATCASVVVYFMTRVTAALARREQELRHAQILRARAEKLQALGTLAAGAAHELASPLSTIAVVAKEVERAIQHSGEEELRDDVALIRSELDRCRAILDRMAAEAGQATGERWATVDVDELVQLVLDGLPSGARVKLHLARDAEQTHLFVPPNVLAQAIRGLIKNAIDASGPQNEVQWAIRRDGETLVSEVSDRGCGMPDAVLERVGEPFFSTKEPGQGMGLGVFLARSVIERLGGSLQFHSQTGEGTTATMKLPIKAADSAPVAHLY